MVFSNGSLYLAFVLIRLKKLQFLCLLAAVISSHIGFWRVILNHTLEKIFFFDEFDFEGNRFLIYFSQ